jgi:sarcosine oxidase subunit gamma
MPDPLPPLQARLPLEGILVPDGPAGGHTRPAGIVLCERAGLGLAAIQARRGRAAELAHVIRERFGIDLPAGPERAAAGPLAFLGVGPGKWLALHDGGDPAFVAGLAAGLTGLAAVVDQSDGYAVLRVSGPAAREALQKALPVDLHPRAFGPGDVAVTSMAHVGVTVWQLDATPVYELAAARSFAGNFHHALLVSAGVYGVRVAPPLAAGIA